MMVMRVILYSGQTSLTCIWDKWLALVGIRSFWETVVEKKSLLKERGEHYRNYLLNADFAWILVELHVQMSPYEPMVVEENKVKV